MRTAAALVAAFLLCSPALHAETTDAAARPGVLARLGTPARPEVVKALLARLDVRDTDAAVRLAHALGHAGGCGALPGLIHLLDHGTDEVRLAAMEAAGRAGLRVEALARRLRRTVREGSAHEMRTAVATLGLVGDGRDAPMLLDLTASEDLRMRATAFRSLAELTGAKMPFVQARWVWYWKGFSDRAARLLPEVLAALEDAIDGPDRDALGDLVRRYGGVDVAELQLTLREWLVSTDPELRAIACRLVGELRLADMSDDVRECLRFAAQREHREVAEEALKALGYRIEREGFNTRGD